MHTNVKCRIEKSKSSNEMQVNVSSSKVIQFVMNTHTVQIAYAWMYNCVALAVVIVVHYCVLWQNPLKSTNQDFHTQMWHKNSVSRNTLKLYWFRLTSDLPRAPCSFGLRFLFVCSSIAFRLLSVCSSFALYLLFVCSSFALTRRTNHL